MKHFLVEITYTAPMVQVDEAVPAHRTFLQTGYSRGWFLYSGPQVPRAGGIILAKAPTLEDLQQLFAADPFQQKGLAAYRYIEFEPSWRQAFMEPWVKDAG